MQNLAVKIAPSLDADAPIARARTTKEPSKTCAACGEKLFGAEAHDTSWQAWGAYWEISATSNVELVCGACGEYLQQFFDD